MSSCILNLHISLVGLLDDLQKNSEHVSWDTLHPGYNFKWIYHLKKQTSPAFKDAMLRNVETALQLIKKTRIPYDFKHKVNENFLYTINLASVLFIFKTNSSMFVICMKCFVLAYV